MGMVMLREDIEELDEPMLILNQAGRRGGCLRAIRAAPAFPRGRPHDFGARPVPASLLHKLTQHHPGMGAPHRSNHRDGTGRRRGRHPAPILLKTQHRRNGGLETLEMRGGILFQGGDGRERLGDRAVYPGQKPARRNADFGKVFLKHSHNMPIYSLEMRVAERFGELKHPRDEKLSDNIRLTQKFKSDTFKSVQRSHLPNPKSSKSGLKTFQTALHALQNPRPGTAAF